MNLLSRIALVGALAGVAAAGAAQAQMKMPTPSKDYRAAPAGANALDQSHTAIIVYVSHVGFSYEAFRFLAASGKLRWNPADPAADALQVSVDPKSIATADAGMDFSGELAGAKFLDVAKFPTATFVSRRFRPIDATHGKVDGDLTIMGVTRPAVFDVTLVGAGNEFGRQTLGIHAQSEIAPNAYGLPQPFFGAPIRLVIDAEFHKTA